MIIRATTMSQAISIQSIDEGSIGCQAATTVNIPEPIELGDTPVASALCIYMNRCIGNYANNLHFSPLAPDPNYLGIKLRVGPPSQTPVNPNNLLEEGLLYNPDSKNESVYIQQLSEAFSTGTGAESIRDALAVIFPSVEVDHIDVYGFEIEQDVFYQQITRVYPDDYPAEFRYKSQVELGRPVLYLAVVCR